MKSTIRILVVDDMSSMRRLVVKYFSELGYQHVVEASNGNEAFSLLQKQTFDLVVTDWSMPRMTGLELLQAIRKEPELKHIPVLLITAEARKENILAAVRSGANGYVVKPFTMITLGEKVDSILQRSCSGVTAPSS
ncbi:MAG: two-component system chemotaxis response regulator CheY [Burkholderiaceae bacterium]|jgi:two-component system chemotaxis response regulator CheY